MNWKGRRQNGRGLIRDNMSNWLGDTKKNQDSHSTQPDSDPGSEHGTSQIRSATHSTAK